MDLNELIIKQGLFVQINILTKEGVLWSRDKKRAICFFNYMGISIPDGTSEGNDEYIMGYFGGFVEVKLVKKQISVDDKLHRQLKNVRLFRIDLLEIRNITPVQEIKKDETKSDNKTED
jgi:hypothetical protein